MCPQWQVDRNKGQFTPKPSSKISPSCELLCGRSFMLREAAAQFHAVQYGSHTERCWRNRTEVGRASQQDSGLRTASWPLEGKSQWHLSVQ
jgi:hypothetical protein